MSCGFTISNLLIPKAVQSNTASPYGKQLRYNKCSTKTCETILDVVAGDKVKNNAYQDARDMATKQGSRRLQATIYFLAIQMVQLSSKGTPRNPVVRAYCEKRKAEGKTSQQALICISRRLISIIYGMLKNGTEHFFYVFVFHLSEVIYISANRNYFYNMTEPCSQEFNWPLLSI